MEGTISIKREGRVMGYLSQKDGSLPLYFVKEADTEQYGAWTDPRNGPNPVSYDQLVDWGNSRGATHLNGVPWSGQ